MIPSLQEIVIRTIIKNDIVPDCQYHLEKLIIEFCESHPDEVNSPQSYWKLHGSYKFLSERKVTCEYKGPSVLYWNTFLDDETNLTTKFINSEMKKYIKLNMSFSSKFLSNYVVPYQASFEFTPEYIKHTGSRYHELGIETSIYRSVQVELKNALMFLPYTMSYSFKSNVYAHGIYKYGPVVYVCENEMAEQVINVLNKQLKIALNRPLFIFDSNLKFVDKCVEIDDQVMAMIWLERIKWFRTTIHATYMSELHFMLLDCDVTHRVLSMMSLYPSVVIKDEMCEWDDESLESD